MISFSGRIRAFWPLLVLLALALGLRLLVWRWREPYPLGGDETEYFNQALALLRDKQYSELRLMRPPLYTVFLAGSIYLFDSLVQRLRLVQELIGVLTVLPLYGLAWHLFRSRRVALLAGLLFALNYTLAATATELLTETVFLFGLCVALWLLAWAAPPLQRRRLLLAALAGLVLGALTLVRSVALPMLGLAALWLLFAQPWRMPFHAWVRRAVVAPLVLVACALAVVLPWTARNYATYHALILVDTTGAENLWLDNNPSAASANDRLGREAAKAKLYALGDDRAARQALASQRGLAEISGNPGWFVQKAWHEAKLFFALQYFDELRDKRAIWVPPGEVAAKLLLGDGLWLLLLFGGVAGMWLHHRDTRLPWLARVLSDPRLYLGLWAAYILFTSMLFHVELRYRLPIYPVLAPYTAWALLALFERRPQHSRWQAFGAAASAAVLLGMTLLHRGYPAESWMLVNKHLALWQAERALAAGDFASAQQFAESALAWDDTSALARVALARGALGQNDRATAEAVLGAAEEALQAHPLPHLLRGALLRQQGQPEQASAELAFETGSLQDLQTWAWQAFAPIGAPPERLNIGGGLDLGFVQGFYPAEANARWSHATAQLQLRSASPASVLELELAGGRPAGAPAPTVVVSANNQELGRFTLEGGWQTIRLPLQVPADSVQIRITADTFSPRQFDPASPDNRTLGVLVRRAALLEQPE